MPELVVARHGRYELVQQSDSLEVREDIAKRRRAGAVLATLLLGGAAILHFQFAHALAIPFAMLGAFALVTIALPRGKVLVIGESEVHYGAAGATHAGGGMWPRARIARVRVDKHGTVPRPAERGRRFGPVWIVRIVASDGALHPARFAFRNDRSAADLARALADRLDVPMESAK